MKTFFRLLWIYLGTYFLEQLAVVVIVIGLLLLLWGILR